MRNAAHRLCIILAALFFIASCEQTNQHGGVSSGQTDTSPPKLLQVAETDPFYVAGLEYTALKFRVPLVEQKPPKKMEATFTNLIRRAFIKENHAALLVLRVERYTTPITNRPMRIVDSTVTVPVFSLLYDENGVPTNQQVHNTGGQIFPWLPTATGQSFKFEFLLITAKMTKSEIADRILKLSRFVAAIAGNSNLILATADPKNDRRAAAVDANFSAGLSNVSLNNLKGELQVGRVKGRVEAAEITLSSSDDIPEVKLTVKVDYKKSLMAGEDATWANVPAFPKDSAAILGTKIGIWEPSVNGAGPTGSGDAGQVVNTTLKDILSKKEWYEEWKKATDETSFVDGCRSILSEARKYFAGYDATAVLWAELTDHIDFERKYIRSKCIQPEQKSRLASLGLSFKDLGSWPECKIAANERVAKNGVTSISDGPGYWKVAVSEKGGNLLKLPNWFHAGDEKQSDEMFKWARKFRKEDCKNIDGNEDPNFPNLNGCENSENKFSLFSGGSISYRVSDTQRLIMRSSDGATLIVWHGGKDGFITLLKDELEEILTTCPK